MYRSKFEAVELGSGAKMLRKGSLSVSGEALFSAPLITVWKRKRRFIARRENFVACWDVSEITLCAISCTPPPASTMVTESQAGQKKVMFFLFSVVKKNVAFLIYPFMALSLL